MRKQFIKNALFSHRFLFALLAFLLPLLFYGNVFLGRSFGFECATGVNGTDKAYMQTPKKDNMYCATIIDPGAYVWQHPAHWTDLTRQYLHLQIPLWTQHIGLGFPLAANFQSGAFFVLGFPFWLMFTLSKGNLFHIDLYFLFRYMMMSLGMYLFLRSFGLRRLICYIGAVVYFNIGYFILIPNIAHHSVDMLLPFVGWAINNLYFTRRKKWIGIGIIILGLSMLAGMPEASIFTLFFAGLYVLFLSLTFAKDKMRMFILGCLMIIGGLLIGSVLYLPGMEYLLLGMTIHHDTSGVIKSIPTEYISTLIFPELFGGPVTRDQGVKLLGETKYIGPGWNYIGFTITFLFLSSLAFIPSFIKIKEKRWGWTYFFFAVLAIVMILQQYDLVSFFFFEHFPVFAQTQYSKYSGALLSMSVITAACLFLGAAIKYNSKVFLGGIVAMILLSVAYNAHYLPIVMDMTFTTTLFGFIANIFYALFFLSLIGLAFLFIKNKRIVLLIMLGVVILEMYSYLPKDGDMQRRESITSVPPAVTFLMKHTDLSSRILGVEDILYPDLADVYNLNDIRMLDAIWSKRTYIFYKTYFYEPDAFRIIGINEQSGNPVDIVNNPFFDLFSTKYIISYNPLESFTSGPTVQSLLKQHKSEFNDMFGPARFKVKEEIKDVIFMHAPSRKTFTFTKPAGAKTLAVFPMIDPSVFDSEKGDGVIMIATIKDKNGNLLATNQSTINPARIKADQQWKKLIVGPLPNSEQSYPVQVQLETLPGENNGYDGAGWSGFYWDNLEKKTNIIYKNVFNYEMKVYEKTNLLPRIHFVKTVDCVPNDEKNDFKNVISKMNAYASTIRNTAVIEAKSCDSFQTYTGKGTIKNQNYQDNKVSFTYTSSTPQYIVLQDAYYPGWEAYVNGKKVAIDPVNITFRGIHVPAGEDVHVTFVYQPIWFKIGFVLSMISLGFAIILIRSKQEIV